MQLNGKLVLCLMGFMALAACSGGGGGGGSKNYAKSTADFQEIAQNFSRIEASAKQNRLQDTSEINKSALSEDDTIVREKSRRMQEAMAQCQVDMVTPEPRRNSPTQDLKFSLKIYGNCPVTAQYDFGMYASDTQMSMNLNIEMNITDATLAAMNDVYGTKIAGSFKANRNGGNGTLTGKILSQKFGTVDVNGSVEARGNQNSAVISGTIAFTIKGEVTEFSVRNEQNANGAKTDYAINGKSVTAQEFQEVIKDLSFLGQTMNNSSTLSAAFGF